MGNEYQEIRGEILGKDVTTGESRVIRTDTNGNQLVQEVGSYLTQAPTVGAVTVGNTPTELKAGGTALDGRYKLIVYPPSAGVVYWGGVGVTSLTGAPLASTDSPVVFDFQGGTVIPIYAINDGTNRDVRVVECK